MAAVNLSLSIYKEFDWWKDERRRKTKINYQQISKSIRFPLRNECHGTRVDIIAIIWSSKTKYILYYMIYVYVREYFYLSRVKSVWLGAFEYVWVRVFVICMTYYKEQKNWCQNFSHDEFPEVILKCCHKVKSCVAFLSDQSARCACNLHLNNLTHTRIFLLWRFKLHSNQK